MYQMIDKYQPDNCQLHQAMELHTLDVILNACRCYYFHPAYSKSYRDFSEEISEMKSKPLFHAVIWNNKSESLSLKKKILKKLLRLPCIWPLKLMCDVNEKLKKGG